MSQRKDHDLPSILRGCRKQLRAPQHALYKLFYGYGMSVAVRYSQNEEEALSQINYKDLIRMVQSLGTAYRTVFNLYVIDGFKHEEIAKTLGITVSTSKSNLSRARYRMRELLKEQINR